MRGNQSKAPSQKCPHNWAPGSCYNTQPHQALPRLSQSLAGFLEEQAVLVMQSRFPADEIQPRPGKASLIRKQFKLTTSACASLKRREYSRLGRGLPWGPAKASIQGLQGGRASIPATWPTWQASSRWLLPGIQGRTQEEQLVAVLAQPSFCDMRQQEIPRSQATLCAAPERSKESPSCPKTPLCYMSPEGGGWV